MRHTTSVEESTAALVNGIHQETWFLKDRECSVCGEPIAFKIPFTNACEHPVETCIDCVAGHLAAQMASQVPKGSVIADLRNFQGSIKCASVDCPHYLAYKDRSRIIEYLQDYTLTQTWQNYERHLSDATFANVKNQSTLLEKSLLTKETVFVWCSNPDCGAPLYIDPKNKFGVVTCKNCDQRTCIEHEEVGLPQEHTILTTVGPVIVRSLNWNNKGGG